MGALDHIILGTKRPLRVAGYCRVSTDEEQQRGSFENQREFFKKAIMEHPDWQFAGIFGDNAKTGTSVVKRFGFQSMMRQAEKGCIDYIIAKDVARFSRSVTDTCTALQKLRSLDVGVYFMDQGIDSFANGVDLAIDAMASISEMESTSISQNVKCSLDSMNKMGVPMRKAAYGYRKEGRAWEVVPKQAVRVRLAFLMAAEGYSFTEIAKRLNQFEERDHTGREWNLHMVKGMFSNEVYIGDILTNKHLVIWTGKEKKEIRNDRLVDQYYVEGHHAPMVGKPLFERVKEMLEAKELAGQKCFKGLQDLPLLARDDVLLDEVRKLPPYEKPRWMKRGGRA